VSFSFSVPSWVSSQSSFTSISEFSGVKTSANSLSVSFSSLFFNPSTGVLSVSLALPYAVAIENIYITYIIFSQSSPISYSPFNPASPPSAAYTFVGLETINSAGSTFSGSAFSAPTASVSGLICVGSGCPSSCVSSQTCLSSGGQVSGNYCSVCGSGQTMVNGNCQSVNNCGQNQYWSGSQCLCNSGYILVSGICYQSCGSNAYIVNSQCACVPGYTYSSAYNQCVSQNVNCGANFVLVNGNCVCASGYGMINGLCVSCPANSYVNGVGNCQCVTGYLLSSTTLTCVSQNTCFPNSTPNSLGQCVCNNGYYNQGSQCIPQSCPNGMVFNGVNCVCPSGQVTDSISGLCTYCNNYGQAVQGSSCVCTSTYYPAATGCAPCTANSVYNSTLKQCVCLPGYTLSNGQCSALPNCPSGSQWNAQTSACQCVTQGYYLINNVCSPCPANAQWNGTSCQCNSGYILSGSVCVSSCPAGSAWNGVSCVCSTGYYLIGSSCVQCDPHSTYNAAQQTCSCNSGYYGNWQNCYSCDNSCASCWGPANTQCTSCRGSTSLNSNGGCSSSCGSGQYVSPNNLCLNCMANCALCYSADICATCASGYSSSLTVVGSNIVMSCQLVPTGSSSKLSLRSYVVGNSVVYQGVALSLMPTDILANGCSICDSLLLVNIVSTYSAATASVSYITNSQYWFLITFDFSGAAFIPTFQFTVQIDPLYASSFTSADMAQKLSSTINPQAATTSTATSTLATPTAGAVRTRPSLTGTSTLSPSTPVSTQLTPKVTNSQVALLFG
jgi:hypothetical protein